MMGAVGADESQVRHGRGEGESRDAAVREPGHQGGPDGHRSPCRSDPEGHPAADRGAGRC